MEGDWGAFEELAQLLGEPSLVQDVQSVYPVTPITPELDFSWLVGERNDDEMGEDGTSTPSFSVINSTKIVGIEDTSIENLVFDESIDLEVDLGYEELEIALARNQECQEVLIRMIESLEVELEDSSRSIQKARELQSVYPAMSRQIIQLLSDPFGMVLKNFEANKIPLSREQADSYNRLQLDHDHRSKTWKWTRQQRRQLAKGIRQQNQKMLMEGVIEHGGALSDMQRELDRIKSLDDRTLEMMDNPRIEFEKISQSFVPKKSALDCEIQWKNVDHPAFNRNEKWDEKELKKLKACGDLVLKGNMNWVDVARDIGSNRTPFSCILEYQKIFQPHGAKGKWNAEEDAALQAAVARYGESDWPRIAAHVPGRTSNQCVHRWKKALSPHIRRGRWTREEDAALKYAVESNPEGSWQIVAQAVPGRTDVQCRERWSNILDPDLKHGKFSSEEDKTLSQAVTELGEGRWAAVVARLPGRTDNQCRRRWHRLLKLKAKANKSHKN